MVIFFWPLTIWCVWQSWLDSAQEDDKRHEEGNVIYVDFKRRRRA